MHKEGYRMKPQDGMIHSIFPTEGAQTEASVDDIVPIMLIKVTFWFVCMFQVLVSARPLFKQIQSTIIWKLMW